MAKKITGYIKLQIPAGKANPSPPVGPALGQRGLNIMAFVKEFNAATKMIHMNANDVEGAVSMLTGSARSMGITVVEG